MYAGSGLPREKPVNQILITTLDKVNSLAAGLLIAASLLAGATLMRDHFNVVGIYFIIGGPIAAAVVFGVFATLLDIRHQLVLLNRKGA
jgi:hypothetical protein